MKEMKNEDLIARFYDHITDKKISQNKVARELGYSGSVLSQYKKGSYQGDVKKLEKEMENWLSKQMRKNKMKKVDFVETSIFKRIYGALSTAHEEKTMGFIVGKAGIGKTVAIKKYQEENPNTYVIQGESGLKENDVVRKLAKLCNIKGYAVITLKESLVDYFKDSASLVIVDEANYLTGNVLDMLRRNIFDQAECPIVFTGVTELMGNIFLNSRDFHQLQRRIGVFLDLKKEGLKLSDTTQMVKTVFPEAEKEMIKKVQDITGGNAGLTALLVERAYRTASLNDMNQLDEDILESCRQSVFLTAKKDF